MKKKIIFASVAICLCLVVVFATLKQNNSAMNADTGSSTEPTQETTQGGTEATQETTQGATVPQRQNVCGDNATWSISADKTVLTISGTGDMYSCDPQPWAAYTLDIKEVIVEDGITSIGDYAFKGFAYMTKASIPDSIVKIGNNAFNGCQDLNGMQIPAGVTQIGSRAFYMCFDLENIKIPDGIETLEYQTFYCCWGMSEIDIPASVTTIQQRAFEQCTHLKKVNFLGDAPTIGADAFDMAPAKGYYEYSNESWTQDIVKSYEKIFRFGLAAANEPPPPTEGTFGDSNIMEWKLENGTLYITGNGDMDGFLSTKKDMPWYPYREQIQAVVMKGNIQSIYSGAFMDCVNLKTVTWPTGVDTIFDHVFSGCTALEEIQIPNSVTQIREFAFSGCVSLKSLKLPKNLTHIHWGAFASCESLEAVELPAKLKVISTSAFQWTKIKQITIPAGVETLGDSVFSNCTKLEKVTFLGTKITTIPRYAFQDCQSLVSITLPSSINAIEWGAFDCCENLKAIYFRGNMPTLDTHFWMDVTLYYPSGNKTWTEAKITAFLNINKGGVKFAPYNP